MRLEPLSVEHHDDLKRASADGNLWELWYTSVPEPEETLAYIKSALEGQTGGHMVPWAVRELGSSKIVGSTRYHDIVIPAHRVEIGFTWYSRSWQRTHVNSACKLLLLMHAFEELACGVVGFRTDQVNHASQRAIERLGAKKDGVIRHHQVRRDGSVRDTVMYSILLREWSDVRKQLELRLAT